MALENKSRFFCRIVLPEKLSINESGYFLPNARRSLIENGASVPLVHPSELTKIINFFYDRATWDIDENKNFILLIFYVHLLEELQNVSHRSLSKYGEFFAKANTLALKEAFTCTARKNGDKVEFTIDAPYSIDK